MSMIILFPVLVALFFLLVHILAYTRIVEHLHICNSTRKALYFFLFVNMTAILGYVASRYLFSPPKLLYFFLSLSIGVGFVLFMGIVLYEFLRLIQRLVPFQEEKRRFFKRSSDIGFLALGSTYIGAGVLEGSKEPAVHYVDIDQKRFNGKRYTIVQISDMHIGGLIDKAFVAKSVAAINRLNPDLVTITGDLADAHIDILKDAVGELRHLKSRFGTYYVVGNHEYFHSIDDTIAYMKELGIHVLENSSLKIDDFYIAGVYDLAGFRADTHIPDIYEAMWGIPQDASTLLLAHQPKYIDYLEGFTPSLILSGHTHGGQIWPFGYLVTLAQPYLKGLHSLGDNRHIYVNSGIGFWGPPMRLGSHSEITCITWS
ncbi:MAG: metallophosphoesterase [Sulfuricurvum sp.]|uniref:metallophosphoesterase n=1 Tax=Sulfuricurvum sp. TaxID=2025608 RepID=UPI003D0CAF3D